MPFKKSSSTPRYATKTTKTASKPPEPALPKTVKGIDLKEALRQLDLHIEGIGHHMGGGRIQLLDSRAKMATHQDEARKIVRDLRGGG